MADGGTAGSGGSGLEEPLHGSASTPGEAGEVT